MPLMLIAFYGLYLLLVGVNGNSTEMVAKFREDAPGFFPWAVSIAVLAVLSELPSTRQLVAPFAFLLILTFILRNFETLRAQYNQIYSAATSQN